MVGTGGWPAGTTFVQQPDWSWRLAFVQDVRPDDATAGARPTYAQPKGLAADVDPIMAAAGYRNTLDRHAKALADVPPRRVTFTANIGVVTFTRVGTDLTVTQELNCVHRNAPVPTEPSQLNVAVATLALDTTAAPTIP
jgi:hypothetical protein